MPLRATMDDVRAILGEPDREAGSGRCIFVYGLADGSEIEVNTGDCRNLGWVERRIPGRAPSRLFAAR